LTEKIHTWLALRITELPSKGTVEERVNMMADCHVTYVASKPIQVFRLSSLLVNNPGWYATANRNSESKQEIPGNFWNVVLEKDGEDQFSRLREK
jgi:hypothetical protein